MEISQILRLPKKYWELFETMSNEEAGKLIKAIFTWDTGEIKGLTSTYYNIINVDLENLEKSATNWKKWGRPKKEITPGYEKEKPLVIKSDNLKEEKDKEKDKGKDFKKNYIKEYQEFIEINKWKKNLSCIIIKSFIDLWYKPTEDIDIFRDWVTTRIIKVYQFNYSDIERIVNNFYDYWKETTPQKRAGKNWKSTFANNFEIKALPYKTNT
jgi:hypothetical protein